MRVENFDWPFNSEISQIQKLHFCNFFTNFRQALTFLWAFGIRPWNWQSSQLIKNISLLFGQVQIRTTIFGTLYVGFAPQNDHFCQKCPSWGLEKWHFQCRYEKSETTFIRQTIPKNEVYDLWFHFWPLLHAFLGDFHFLALLGPILEGKSDQN